MAKRELPKHVYCQKNGIYFQRPGWAPQKFEHDFGTPEFWKEYADILADKDKPRVITSRTFVALKKTSRLALARRIAVILHQIWIDGSVFQPDATPKMI